MDDTLTTASLNRLIRELTTEREAIFTRMIGPDLKPLISPLGDEWAALGARHDEVCGMLQDAYALLLKREMAPVSLIHSHEYDNEPPVQVDANGDLYPYMCKACDAETGDPYAWTGRA